MGRPTVFPTGTTIYDPAKCQGGYTLFVGKGKGAMLVDMNGNVIRHWKDVQGMPCKMIPGGHLFGSLGMRDRDAAYQDMTDVTMIDFDGNVEWTFDHNQKVDDEDSGERWVARQHHDYQIEGNPVGYACPGQESSPDFNKMLILTHNDVRKPKISPQMLLEDCLIEIDRAGNITWEWHMLDHFNEFGFPEAQKNVMYRNPNIQEAGPEGEGDIFHVNCASYLGPNHWYDEGDERFAPDNIIMDSRETNVMWIVDHETGKIVWQVGPDYTQTRELRRFGTLIGPHHTHMIPKGLPGAGNIMVYDNGGWAGYGVPSQVSKIGIKTERRDGSRVVEFNPTNMKIAWQLDSAALGMPAPFATHCFYSPLTSDAQRLENGNTFICEGTTGRFYQITPDNEIVWEYIYPLIDKELIYRAYHIPYDWIPQVEHPVEVPVERLDNSEFTVPGAAKFDLEGKVVTVEGTKGYGRPAAFCVDKLD